MNKRHGYSPAVKTVIKAPPTEEMREAALRVLTMRRPTDEEQFIDEVRMLGLDDLIAV